MTDNKGKLFGKINIIDLFVILIIIAAIGVTYFKFNLSAHSDVVSSNGTVEYTLFAKSVRMYTVEQLVEGDKIYDEESGKCVGTIIGVEYEPAYDYVIKTDGTPVYSRIPEKYNVKVKVRADAVINGMGVNANGSKSLYYNQNGTYYTKRAQVEFRITDLNVIN